VGDGIAERFQLVDGRLELAGALFHFLLEPCIQGLDLACMRLRLVISKNEATTA